MKKVFLLLSILALISIDLISQSWISSNKLYGEDDVNTINSAISNDDAVIVLGFFTGTIQTPTGDLLSSFGGRDYYIVKFNRSGEVEWINQLGGNSNEFVTGGVGVTPLNEIIVAGSFQNYLKYSDQDSIQSTGAHDNFLVKYSSDGELVWAKNIGKGAKLQTVTGLSIDNDGNILLTGQFRDSIEIDQSTTLYSDNTSNEIFYSKFTSSDGSLIWAKHIETLSNASSGGIFSVESGSEWYAFSGVFKDSIVLENDTLISLNSSQDIFAFKTNIQGEIEWTRKISGENFEYCYNILTDQQDNLYLGGYYDSQSLIVDSTSTDTSFVSTNLGSFDLIIVKYSPSGNLVWKRTAGSKYEDKINRSDIFENTVYYSGTFRDTLFWGGIQLTSKGSSDQDMMIGSLDLDGNFRSANSYSGRNNSTEEGRSIFQNGEELYSIIRSNSDLLVLGDSIYTSTNNKYYVAMGVIGCLPIIVDNIIVTDVQECYGDSTGALQIIASEGFGAPWQYSIDNGNTYQPDISYFDSLTAGDYRITVVDKEGCVKDAGIWTVNQPDSLWLDVLTVANVTPTEDGVIQVAAYGGTSPYTFTLQPDGTVQGFGTYNFGPADTGTYVVEVNDLRNCGPVSTDSITIAYGPDNVDPANAPELRVYPNPTSGSFTLEMPVEVDACTIEVLSLTGQVVHSQYAYSTGGMIYEVIDVSHLSKGMYMLRVNGKTLRSGVVVN